MSRLLKFITMMTLVAFFTSFNCAVVGCSLFLATLCLRQIRLWRTRLLASQPVRKFLNGMKTNMFVFTKSIIYEFGLFLFLFFLTGQGGCGINDAIVGSSSSNNALSVTTEPATEITRTTAILNGTVVNPNGVATTVYFNYQPEGRGLTNGLSTTISQTVRGICKSATVWTTISELSPNTLYYFRVVGTNSSGTTYGNNLTFTTSN